MSDAIAGIRSHTCTNFIFATARECKATSSSHEVFDKQHFSSRHHGISCHTRCNQPYMVAWCQYRHVQADVNQTNVDDACPRV